MSDAMIKGAIQNKPLRGNQWGGINVPLSRNTAVTGYADGSGSVHFRLPVGSWAFGLCMINYLCDDGYSGVTLKYSMLDPSVEADDVRIGQTVQAGIAQSRLQLYTDEWGNAYLEILADVESGVVGGAVGILTFDATWQAYDTTRHTYVTTENTARMRLARGHPNQPWLLATLPQHKAALYPIRPNDLYWRADQFYQYRQYRPTMAAASVQVSNAYPHYQHPELVPYVDDGSYAWLSIPNACGADTFCPDVDNGTNFTVHAATHAYQKTVGSTSRSHTIQHIGDAIRQKKGSSPCMGLAQLPVYVKKYSAGIADPPFCDTFASQENIPVDESMPWFLPAFVTVENGVAYAHIRIPFQNIPHAMGWKTDSQWSWTTGIHGNTAQTALPELLLMNDGSGTNLLSGITLEGTGGAGGTIAQDAGGITVRAELSAVPSIGEHACFVKCQGAYIRINSPAANGNGESPAQEESFNPYPNE